MKSSVETPRYILREIYQRVPWLKCIQYDDFSAIEKLDPAKELSPSEFAALQVLQQHGGIASSKVLNDALVATKNMSSPSLHVVLSQSPIIMEYARGIFGVRGPRPDPTALAGAVSSQRRPPR